MKKHGVCRKFIEPAETMVFIRFLQFFEQKIILFFIRFLNFRHFSNSGWSADAPSSAPSPRKFPKMPKTHENNCRKIIEPCRNYGFHKISAMFGKAKKKKINVFCNFCNLFKAGWSAVAASLAPSPTQHAENVWRFMLFFPKMCRNNVFHTHFSAKPMICHTFSPFSAFFWLIGRGEQPSTQP